MKKQHDGDDSEMLPEYDLGSMKGVRGRYHERYRAGHAVTIHREDGSASTQYFGLEEGAVMLDPDVREYFTDSSTVNQTLRALIGLIPKHP